MFCIALAILALLFLVNAYKIRSLQSSLEDMATLWAQSHARTAAEIERSKRDVEEMAQRLRDIEARVRVAESYARESYRWDER